MQRNENGEDGQKPLHVLLVEDGLVHQRLARGLLENWGHRVTIATNGNEAVALSGQDQFDLILMDVEMPELDGLEATRRIRAAQRLSRQHVPILGVTTYEDRQACRAAGMDAFTTKPVNAQHLSASLQLLLGRQVRNVA